MEGELRVALVVGVTGIVGLSLAEKLANEAELPWKVYGVARRPRPAWLSHLPQLHYIQCDLLDPQQTLASLSPLADVTHLFYATWTECATEEANVTANVNMLRHTLDALPPTLRHVSLQTGTKHYLGSHLLWQQPSAGTPLRIYTEDTPRLLEPNFYYGQEDLLHARAASLPLTWSVHRPGIIIGASPIASINISLALATYASICKNHQPPIPFHFPLSLVAWESHVDVSDADLVAEQEIWAATHRVNEALNVGNGDSITWKVLWPAIARSFDLEAPPYMGQSVSIVNTLQDKAHVWDALVSQHNLLPTRWEYLLSGWGFIDILNHMPPHKVSMAKNAKLGFFGSRDTLASFLTSFDKMRKMHIIP